MNAESRKFTGTHAAIIFIGCFAIIILVNIALTVFAVRSFPGMEVRNSYVASQEFDEQKARQQALGWQTEVTYEDEKVRLFIHDENGHLITPNAISLRVGRATTDQYDQTLDLRFDGEAFSANKPLGKGEWLVFLDITAADNTPFKQIHKLWITQDE